jgi:hypothetical protein
MVSPRGAVSVSKLRILAAGTGQNPIEEGYQDWRQVSGYFDGDGSVYVLYGKWTVRFKLTWTDSSRQQVSQIREFLVSHGIRPAPKIIFALGAYTVVVGDQAEVLKAAREMLPFVYKKRDELQTIIDYRGDRVTGSEVFERFKAFQASGMREKSHWPSLDDVDIPLSRSDGYKRGRAAGGNSRIRLTTTQIREIKVAHEKLGRTVNYLAHKFHVSNSTVARALRLDVTAVSAD